MQRYYFGIWSWLLYFWLRQTFINNLDVLWEHFNKEIILFGKRLLVRN
jgi:hypothetical protein